MGDYFSCFIIAFPALISVIYFSEYRTNLSLWHALSVDLLPKKKARLLLIQPLKILNVIC